VAAMLELPQNELHAELVDTKNKHEGYIVVAPNNPETQISIPETAPVTYVPHLSF
jgi:hypothetical protein